MKLYRQIILLTLTLLVLVSSTGMAVGMHICGGELRDVTFFGAKADCPMEQQQETLPPCHAPKEKKAGDNNCCQNHKVVVERHDAAADTKAISLQKLQDIKFLAMVKVVILRLLAPASAANATYAHYTSPPLARDIPLLVRSFLL